MLHHHHKSQWTKSIIRRASAKFHEIHKNTQNTTKFAKNHNNFFLNSFIQGHPIHVVIIKFPYNARFDWLKQRTLSENKE